MTSAALPLSRGAPGTQPRAVDALRLLWSELPRRETSEEVRNGGKRAPGVWKGDCRPQGPRRPFFFFHHPPPAGNGLFPRLPPGDEVREPTWQTGHRTKVVPLFSGLGSRREVGRDRGVFALLTGAPSWRLVDARPWTASAEAQNRRRDPPHQSQTGPRTMALAKARAL